MWQAGKGGLNTDSATRVCACMHVLLWTETRFLCAKHVVYHSVILLVLFVNTLNIKGHTSCQQYYLRQHRGTFLFNISKFHFIFLLVSSKKPHPSLKNLNFFTGTMSPERKKWKASGALSSLLHTSSANKQLAVQRQQWQSPDLTITSSKSFLLVTEK